MKSGNTIEYHRLGGQNNKNLFLTVLGAKKSKINMLAGRFGSLMRAFFLGYLLIVSFEGERECESKSKRESVRVSIIWMISRFEVFETELTLMEWVI